jgi:RNA polymerase sigma-70 factor (ECF subfamily)
MKETSGRSGRDAAWYPDDAGSGGESTSPPDAAALLADPRGFRDTAALLTAWLLARHGASQFDRVEDAVQDAFVAAARAWPLSGAPREPVAWLRQVAVRRFLDRVRADRRLVADGGEAAALTPDGHGLSPEAVPPDTDVSALDSPPLADEQLRLLFMCCHPALTAESRVALTLKCVAQLSVEEIARALQAEPTAVAQRLVRAKRTLRDVRASFVVPHDTDLPARLDDVLAVCYAIFSEGHLVTDGDALVRPELCTEALRMVSHLAQWPATAVPATHALQALLWFTVARLPAREADGQVVPLAEQDRHRWDARCIARGLHAFDRAAVGQTLTRYHVEAEIAMRHTTAPSYAETPWPVIVAAYERLRALVPTPSVRLAHAVALAEAGELDGALAEARSLAAAIPGWPDAQATLATLAARAGATGEADAAFARALEHPIPLPVRRHWQQQRNALSGAVPEEAQP